MNHQQRLVAALAGTAFAIGALCIVGGVAMRRAAWVSVGAGICGAAGIYAYIHWSR